MAWKGDSRRHGLARKGVKTSKRIIRNPEPRRTSYQPPMPTFTPREKKGLSELFYAEDTEDWEIPRKKVKYLRTRKDGMREFIDIDESKELGILVRLIEQKYDALDGKKVFNPDGAYVSYYHDSGAEFDGEDLDIVKSNGYGTWVSSRLKVPALELKSGMKVKVDLGGEKLPYAIILPEQHQKDIGRWLHGEDRLHPEDFIMIKYRTGGGWAEYMPVNVERIVAVQEEGNRKYTDVRDYQKEGRAKGGLSVVKE